MFNLEENWLSLQSICVSAIDTVERNFILIAAELWKKLAPKDDERANVLNDITMKALFSERYQVAVGTSRFQMEDRQLQEKWLLYAKLNFWQSKKWADEFVEVQDEVKEADFSAKDDLIQLARYVLLDDFDSALPILKTTMQAGKLPLNDLEEWPIFKNFRADDRVKTAYGDGACESKGDCNVDPRRGRSE